MVCWRVQSLCDGPRRRAGSGGAREAKWGGIIGGEGGRGSGAGQGVQNSVGILEKCHFVTTVFTSISNFDVSSIHAL